MYHIIYNPKSRSGQGTETFLLVRRQLMAEKLPYKEHKTACRKDATKIARALTGDDWNPTGDVLIVIGGDGTVNEVVNGICNLGRVRLGYIPTGSGNDFARGLQISHDPRTALQGILHTQHPIAMDIGYTQAGEKRRRFAISSGWGYDAAICHEALSSKIKVLLNKMHLGKLTYIIIALRQLFHTNMSVLDVRMEDGVIHYYPKVLFAVAMNLPYEGGGCMFAPNASASDGKLDLLVVDGIAKWKVLCLLPLALKGKHTGFREIHLDRCQTVRIHAKTRKAVHLDGESGGYQSTLIWGLEKERLQILK